MKGTSSLVIKIKEAQRFSLKWCEDEPVRVDVPDATFVERLLTAREPAVGAAVVATPGETGVSAIPDDGADAVCDAVSSVADAAADAGSLQTAAGGGAFNAEPSLSLEPPESL